MGGGWTPAVKTLVIACVVAFFLTFIDSRTGSPSFISKFGLTPADVTQRYFLWQVVTYIFLHGGFFHILFNMLGLYMFGSELEATWGRPRDSQQRKRAEPGPPRGTPHMSSPFDPPREKLGSLAQAARSKNLKQVRGILLAIGILTIVVNAIQFFMAEQLIDAELKKRGIVQVNPQEKQEVIGKIHLLAGGLMAVGALVAREVVC